MPIKKLNYQGQQTDAYVNKIMKDNKENQQRMVKKKKEKGRGRATLKSGRKSCIRNSH